MVSSVHALVVIVVSFVFPYARSTSVHLMTDPPVTQAVTRVFPSWLDAFETVKEEPPLIYQQDVPPMVINDPRNTTWKQYSRKLSEQLWRLLNYVHQVNQAPPEDAVLAGIVHYVPTFGPPDPVTGFYYVPADEYDNYRRLRANKHKEGTPEDDMIRPLNMKKGYAQEQIKQNEKADEEVKKVMDWVATGVISPSMTDPPTALRGSTKTGADKAITA